MSGLRWFRMYSECIDDEKLRLLAFEDRWHFVALLCCKANGIIDEAGPLLRRKLAVKLGLDPTALDEVSRRLAEVGLIDQQTFQPLAWDHRQFVSDQDPTAGERLKRFRDKKRGETDVKRVSQRTCNAHETPSETETEADTEIHRSTTKSLGAAESQSTPKSRSPTGSRIPTEFPTTDDIEFCRQQRPDLDASTVAASFRDYWLGVPGAKGRKADWPATWRNWVRNQKREFRPQPRASPVAQRRTEVIAGLTGQQRITEVIDVTPARIG